MKKRRAIILIASIAITAIVTLLHSQGYKFYGYPHMYRSDPPDDEGWRKVVAMERSHFALEDGEKINLQPFHLTARALALSSKDLAKQLFDLSPDDIYVRKEKEKWILRAGNRYISAHQSFFPKRVYGYYEDELLDSLSSSEINVPLGEGLIGADSEEAVERYFKTKAYQGSSDNADKSRV